MGRIIRPRSTMAAVCLKGGESEGGGEAEFLCRVSVAICG